MPLLSASVLVMESILTELRTGQRASKISKVLGHGNNHAYKNKRRGPVFYECKLVPPYRAAGRPEYIRFLCRFLPA